MNLLPAFDTLPPEARDLRRKAYDFASAHGWPSRKLENWRYTSVKALDEHPFTPTLGRSVGPSHETLQTVASLLNPWFYNLVFVNGRLDRALSNLEALPSSIELSPSVPVPATDAFIDTFEALNVVYLGEGLRLRVKDDQVLDRPMRVHFHTALEGASSLMVHPRFVLEVGARAKATIIESYSGSEDGDYFVNPHTEIGVGASARLTYVRVQEDGAKAVHIGRTRISPRADSSVTTMVYSSGARLFRHNFETALSEERTSLEALGAVAATGAQHVDHATEIDHRVGHCNVVQIYKTLLDGESRAIFSGKIHVRPDAQKAQSEQVNKNLLLSSKAEADSKPQLMIEADDVKAAHGATVGQLNREELFYLMSRGLPRSVAVPLLAKGFLTDLIDRLEDESTRAWLKERLSVAMTRLNTENV